MPGLPPNDSTESSHHRENISILPDAPAKDHGAAFDSFPSQIPDLPSSIRTSVASKHIQNPTLQYLLHCLPIPLKEKAKGFTAVCKALPGFFFLTSPPIPLQPYWPPGHSLSTPGTLPTPQELGTGYSHLLKALVPMSPAHETCLATPLKSELQIPMPHF